jgi:lysozyme family protein
MGKEGEQLENNVGDPGKETFWGISRVYQPTWPGWAIIDANGPNDTRLPAMVQDFYRTNFWNKNLLNQLTSAELAAQLFDAFINLGSESVIIWFEDLLGTEQDGVIGPDDVATANALTDVLCFVYQFLAYRKGYYRGLAVFSVNDKADLKGFISRCVLANF